jgi:hypothetical protein
MCPACLNNDDFGANATTNVRQLFGQRWSSPPTTSQARAAFYTTAAVTRIQDHPGGAERENGASLLAMEER